MATAMPMVIYLSLFDTELDITVIFVPSSSGLQGFVIKKMCPVFLDIVIAFALQMDMSYSILK